MSEEAQPATGSGSMVTSRDDAVLRITIDRADHRNALTPSMITRFVDILVEASLDDSLRAIHISGAGDHFCSGVDWVAGNDGDRRPRTGDLLRRVPHTANRIIELVHTVQLPVVCTVRGVAAGLGCNLALAADFTVAAADAVFWEPFAARGFSPDSGATWLLPRVIGLTRAKRMLLLADKIAADQAVDWGLIDRVVPADEVDEVGDELVSRLADGPTVALGLAKQAIHHNQRASLSEAMMQELFDVELSCRTADFKEGLAAYRERRAPRFQGR